MIIPVFNCKKYLRQVVESVILQSYRAIKTVLVDDVSFALCDELANRDKRITVIYQKNSGVALARDASLKYVLLTGESENDYITFIDADNVRALNGIYNRNIKLIEENYDLIGLQACICIICGQGEEVVLMQEGEYIGIVTSIWIHANQYMGTKLY